MISANTIFNVCTEVEQSKEPSAYPSKYSAAEDYITAMFKATMVHFYLSAGVSKTEATAYSRELYKHVMANAKHKSELVRLFIAFLNECCNSNFYEQVFSCATDINKMTLLITSVMYDGDYELVENDIEDLCKAIKMFVYKCNVTFSKFNYSTIDDIVRLYYNYKEKHNGILYMSIIDDCELYIHYADHILSIYLSTGVREAMCKMVALHNVLNNIEEWGKLVTSCLEEYNEKHSDVSSCSRLFCTIINQHIDKVLNKG